MNTPKTRPTNAGWRFDHSYQKLPSSFYARTLPVPVQEPAWVILNRALCAELGLDADALATPAGARWLAGNEIPPDAEPIAQAYAGHQFGHFTLLGDGRAHVLGEHLMPDGQRVDIQLKGSGPTPFSRRGDGRAALGPMLREYVISEAMHALGIPTTRSLAVVATGEPVYRETPLPGAVLTRIAKSHIRVGTFQFAAARGGPDAVRALADYTVQRHFPEAKETANPYQALFTVVAERQEELIAQWLSVGFIHGVMNTDNMALCGETIDYGPCAFMDIYDPATVFSSIDQQGRYAYGNQPHIAQWNLARFAETLLPLLAKQEEAAIEWAEAALRQFVDTFKNAWRTRMSRKLGLQNASPDDTGLIEDLLGWMHKEKQDFTNTFRQLTPKTSASPSLDEWHARWTQRLAQQGVSDDEATTLMRKNNPAVIPRNHQVEAALDAATQQDLQPFNELLAVLANPYDHENADPAYQTPAPPGTPRYVTFCGT